MFKDLFSLKGRVALVTGGSRGIGKMIAAASSRRARKVYISSRKADACDATAEELSAETATASRCRRTSRPSRAARAGRRVQQREPKLDILVNNAGAAWGAEFDEFPEKRLGQGHGPQRQVAVLPDPGAARRAQGGGERRAAGEGDQHRVDRRHPRSIRWRPTPTTRRKAALIYLTRRMAAKLIADKIVVTAIAPGAVRSEMNRAARDHADEVARAHPAQRIGRDEDMAGAAIFLASRAGDYVVGDTIAVDGGIAYANAGLEIAG